MRAVRGVGTEIDIFQVVGGKGVLSVREDFVEREVGGLALCAHGVEALVQEVGEAAARGLRRA